MFNTIGSFSVVYFTLGIILFLLVLFEKHFIQLEEKIKARKTDAKKVPTKKARKTKNINKSVYGNKANPSVRKTAAASPVKRIPHNAA